jgi:hypothetical protein
MQNGKMDESINNEEKTINNQWTTFKEYGDEIDQYFFDASSHINGF